MSHDDSEGTVSSPAAAPVAAAFTGALGFESVDTFIARLPEMVPGRRTVIDFSAATTLDSSIIAALMVYRRRLEQAGGAGVDIVVIAPERIYRLFEITGVTRAVTVIPAQRRPQAH